MILVVLYFLFRQGIDIAFEVFMKIMKTGNIYTNSTLTVSFSNHLAFYLFEIHNGSNLEKRVEMIR